MPEPAATHYCFHLCAVFYASASDRTPVMCFVGGVHPWVRGFVRPGAYWMKSHHTLFDNVSLVETENKLISFYRYML